MAKAVRIRIRSGNEEHNSLVSLRKNFDIGDVAALWKDGRLNRWLRQKQENGLADRLKMFKPEDPTTWGDKDVLGFLSVFFDDIKKNDNLLDVAIRWENDGFKRNSDSIFVFLLNEGNVDSAKYLYSKKTSFSAKIIIEHLTDEKCKDDTTGNLEFILGKCYYEGIGCNKDPIKAGSLIWRAAQKGQPEAIEFIKNKPNSDNKVSSYWKNKEYDLNYISSILNNYDSSNLTIDYDTYLDFSMHKFSKGEVEIDILSFLKDVSEVERSINKSLESGNASSGVFNSYSLSKYSKSNVYREAITINEILHIKHKKGSSVRNRDSEYYRKTRHEVLIAYPPAFVLSNDISIKPQKEIKKLYKDGYLEMTPLEQVNYIIKHMLEF